MQPSSLYRTREFLIRRCKSSGHKILQELGVFGKRTQKKVMEILKGARSRTAFHYSTLFLAECSGEKQRFLILCEMRVGEKSSSSELVNHSPIWAGRRNFSAAHLTSHRVQDK